MKNSTFDFIKRSVATLIIFGFFTAPVYSECPSFQATLVNIAAQNLSGLTPIKSEKAEVFANAITHFDPEVIVLVEVNPDRIAAEIADELNEIGINYNQSILDQTASQNIAVLYKPGIQLSNPRLIEGSDNNNHSLRKAFAADIKIGEFDFILIGVHESRAL